MNSVVALITARGGSKGLPGKNVAPLAGKPLIAWTVEAALAATRVDEVILSTDDPAIASAARAFGCAVPFMRPDELATDEADSLSVVRHAIASLEREFEWLVLLQPTSPLRSAADIDGAIERAQAADAPCVSVTVMSKSPWWMFTLDTNGRLRRLLEQGELPTRRQDTAETYVLNGAVYVARCRDLLAEGGSFLTPDTVAWAMPEQRSIDIDTPLDLQIAETILGGKP